MILVGMLGGALDADRRPRPAGHRVRGGRLGLRRLRRRARRRSAASPTGRRSGPAARCPTKPALGLALLGVLATVLASLPHYIAGFADQPAATADVRLRRPVRAVEHRSSPSATADGARRARLRRPRRCGRARGGERGRRRPVGRPDARVGTTSPAPADNFADAPTVMSPEPLLDLPAPRASATARARGRAMMHALPAARRRRRAARCSSAPRSPPSRSLMLIGGMLAVWILMRERALDAGETWVPEGVDDPRGAVEHDADRRRRRSCVFAQWAVYAAKRDDRAHTGLALGLVALVRCRRHQRPGLHLHPDGAADRRRAATPAMFYAVTGLFDGADDRRARVHGGRPPSASSVAASTTRVVAAHALYWYVLAAVFAAVWFVVYVTK